MLAPFAKYPLKITLRGVTSGPDDPSVSSCKMDIHINGCNFYRLITIGCVSYLY